MRKFGPVAVVAALCTAGPVLAQDAATPTASATIMDAEGAEVGTATLTAMPAGVIVMAEFTGLPPGAHGFHIHETGACEGDFASAGDHLNPDDSSHGLVEGGPHAGDFPNIHAADDGALTVEAFALGLTMDDAAMGLNDADGSALIVHSDPDDYTSQPSGASGDRIACGVISAE